MPAQQKSLPGTGLASEEVRRELENALGEKFKHLVPVLAPVLVEEYLKNCSNREWLEERALVISTVLQGMKENAGRNSGKTLEMCGQKETAALIVKHPETLMSIADRAKERMPDMLALFKDEGMADLLVSQRQLFLETAEAVGKLKCSGRPKELSDSIGKKTRADFVPEYDYKDYFFTVTKACFSKRTEKPLALEQAAIALEIMDFSQARTVTFAFQSEGLRDQFLNLVSLSQEIGIGERKRLIAAIISGKIRTLVDPKVSEFWAQDFGEPTGGKRSVYVTGWKPEWYETRRKLNVATEPAVTMGALEIPAVLQGGNFTKAAIGREKIIFIGGNDLLESKRQYLAKYGYIPSTQELSDVYKNAFSASQVIFLGGEKTKQPHYLSHIDQAVFFPKDGTAVLLKLELKKGEENDEDGAEAARALGTYAEQLRAAGFKVVEIPTTLEHLKKFQSYANSVAMRDGQRIKVLLPGFGDSGLERRISSILNGAGMEAAFVRDFAYEWQGNVCCMSGMVAEVRRKDIFSKVA